MRGSSSACAPCSTGSPGWSTVDPSTDCPAGGVCEAGGGDSARGAGGLGVGRVHDCRTVTSGVMNLNWRLTTDAGTFAVKQLRDRTPDEIRVVNELLPRLAGDGFPVPTPCGDPVRVDGEWYAATAWLDGVHPES